MFDEEEVHHHLVILCCAGDSARLVGQVAMPFWKFVRALVIPALRHFGSRLAIVPSIVGAIVSYVEPLESRKVTHDMNGVLELCNLISCEMKFLQVRHAAELLYLTDVVRIEIECSTVAKIISEVRWELLNTTQG